MYLEEEPHVPFTSLVHERKALAILKEIRNKDSQKVVYWRISILKFLEISSFFIYYIVLFNLKGTYRRHLSIDSYA